MNRFTENKADAQLQGQLNNQSGKLSFHYDDCLYENNKLNKGQSLTACTAAWRCTKRKWWACSGAPYSPFTNSTTFSITWQLFSNCMSPVKKCLWRCSFMRQLNYFFIFHMLEQTIHFSLPSSRPCSLLIYFFITLGTEKITACENYSSSS